MGKSAETCHVMFMVPRGNRRRKGHSRYGSGRHAGQAWRPEQEVRR
ncbi:hypothetical protein C882_3909 [Caenispirillum salinarum AK4]|uniref:Uncharacterized protein n=1 Tax=Caenispirillum salinarum AK4 TaxID=1238182 RepID=K9HTC8_9PROT|nr:hypothetical protein C882_3909 [Caenispirillum salinarum AK4]